MLNFDVVAIAALLLSVFAGVFVARHMSVSRRKRLLQERLANWSAGNQSVETPMLVRAKPVEGARTFALPKLKFISSLLLQSGSVMNASTFTMICSTIFLLPPLVAVLFQLDILLSLVASVVLTSIPFIVLLVKRAQLRRRFTEQLPDGIDLMVSILRSGHSVPQAVKTVGTELPAPCGSEFQEVLQRMNLGQPLSEALTYSAEKFQSYELDLIKRAVAIQAEVGGSLAELLDKTNSTLRGRLKLVRQVTTLTAQSRLTAIIVGLLPIILAVALNFINPGYLNPLVESGFGKALLAVAVFLQVLGIYIMKKMSTVKV
jgi:tight adherence protein B